MEETVKNEREYSLVAVHLAWSCVTTNTVGVFVGGVGGGLVRDVLVAGLKSPAGWSLNPGAPYVLLVKLLAVR